MRRQVALAVVALLVVAACGPGKGSDDAGSAGPSVTKLFPDNFKGVCSGGRVKDATDYTPSGHHKALLFATYNDDLQDQSHTLPPDWTVLFSPTKDALKAIDVVACAKRTADKVVKTCANYKDDDKATGNKVRWHTASYQVSIRAATTGKLLGQERMEATDETCPMFASFDGKNQTIDMYASIPDSALNDFVGPFIAGKR